MYALDLLATRQRALWHLNELPSPPLVVSRSPAALHLLGGPESERELWRYRMPALSLESKRGLGHRHPCSAEREIGTVLAGAVSPGGVPAWIESGTHAPGELVLIRDPGHGRPFEIALPGHIALQPPLVSERWICTLLRSEGAVVACVLDATRNAGWMQVTLQGLAHACAHLEGDRLWIGDDLGRVLVYDLARGRPLRQLRC